MQCTLARLGDELSMRTFSDASLRASLGGGAEGGGLALIINGGRYHTPAK